MPCLHNLHKKKIHVEISLTIYMKDHSWINRTFYTELNVQAVYEVANVRVEICKHTYTYTSTITIKSDYLILRGK